MSDESNQNRLHVILLAAVIVVAAVLRFAQLDNVPPGIHHDEASNGYDAYCLLKTGADRWNHPWPVFLEAFGRSDYRGAIYAYLTIPFHALLGPERLTRSTRIPAALIGLLTVVLTYVLVARCHAPATGLWAAFFLAISPWHVQLSRIGHEATLTPAFTVLALTLLSQAGWPFRGSQASKVRLHPGWMAAAGAVFTLGIYTYPSMRLFTPTFLIAGAFIYRQALTDARRDPRNRVALTSFLLAAFVVAVPMITFAFAHWDHFVARARVVSAFGQDQSFARAAVRAAGQYLAHFSPNWLALKGDPYIIQSPRGFGQLNIIVAPLAAVGVVLAVKRRHDNRANALVLAWLFLHPLAAAVTVGGPHALRSACGLPAWQWLAAVGAVAIVSAMGATQFRRRIIESAIALAVLIHGSLFARAYFHTWANDPDVVMLYQKHLRDAVRAIRPIAHRYDRIFVSDQNDRDHRWYSGEAYIIVLLALPVPPDDFHRWEKHVEYASPADGFHRVTSFGPFTMTTRTDVVADFFQNHPDQSALFIARPGEITGGTPLKTIADPHGNPMFEVVSVQSRNPR